MKEFKELKEQIVPSKEEVKETVQTLDSIKHIDENGKEYWNAHELGQALGYASYQKFKPAIERAITQMENSGDDAKNNLNLQVEVISNINKGGTVTTREVPGYKVTRKGAYAITLEADPSKPQVAVAHRYMVETTRKGEIAENILSTIKDKSYIDHRPGLSLANRGVSEASLRHDVKENELGIVHNAGDKGMFNASTADLKKEHGVPDNRPMADFLGDRMCVAKTFAQQNSIDRINKQNANGVKEVSQVVFDENRKVRDLIIESSGQAPEQLITGEDVKKVEANYKKLTKSQLKAIEQEF